MAKRFLGRGWYSRVLTNVSTVSTWDLCYRLSSLQNLRRKGGKFDHSTRQPKVMLRHWPECRPRVQLKCRPTGLTTICQIFAKFSGFFWRLISRIPCAKYEGYLTIRSSSFMPISASAESLWCHDNVLVQDIVEMMRLLSVPIRDDWRSVNASNVCGIWKRLSRPMLGML